MPNWCNNTLLVVGDERDLQTFKSLTTYIEEDETHYSILRTFVPCPEELLNTTKGFTRDEEKQKEIQEQQERNIEKYGVPTWYEWSYENWGCKWPDAETTLSVNDDGLLVYQFCTPWSPPVEGIKKIAYLFPTLNFVLSFTEEFNHFIGAIAFSDKQQFDLVGDHQIADKWWASGDYERASIEIEEERKRCSNQLLQLFKKEKKNESN